MATTRELIVGLLIIVMMVAGWGDVAMATDTPRPRWTMEGDVAEVKSELAAWLTLDARTVRARAQGREAEALLSLAEKLLLLRDATDEAGHGERAAALLDVALAEVDDDPAGQITTGGSRDEVNLAVRDAAYLLALRYYATGDEADADAVRRILLRFAEVVPEWPLWDRQGEQRAQDDARYFREWDGRGIWGTWFHMDLERTAGVLRAYDLVYDRLSDDERSAIREGLFDHQVQLIERWPVAYTNMVAHRIIGLAQLGLTLPEPKYVHLAVKYYENMLYVSFFPDGFFREASPSYHTMPATRMQRRIPSLLKGYSDPPGYEHPETGRRFDELDLVAKYARHHERWWQAWDVLTLPNRTTLAVNDAVAGRTAWWSERDLDVTEPRLLGTTGIGVLGHGASGEQMEAYLLFAGSHGHEHYDVLNLAWWAHGREVFSETNYRPVSGSDSTREWHTSSAGHNLVVIDGANQHGRFRGQQRELTEDDGLRGMDTWRWRNASMNQGELLLFDPSADEMQVIEAEGERAYYPTAKLYRRTLAMATLGDGDGYLLDIFRARGGSEHDYVLHGGLDEKYELTHTVATEPTEGTAHKYIALKEAGWAAPPTSFTFAYEDGVRTTSHVVGPTSLDAKGEYGVRFLAGEAPAMRRVGSAPFVMLRRHGGRELAEPGAENTFVLVHEAHRDAAKVASAELVSMTSDDPEAVVVRVTLADGREDVFFSTLSDGEIRLADGTVFEGRLGWQRRGTDGRETLRVFDGRRLTNAAGDGVQGVEPLHGRVMATQRVEAGDAREALVVDRPLPDDGSLVGRTVHVAFGDEMTWSYRIRSVENDANGSAVVELEHEPGFEIREDGALAKMLFYPGWGFREAATFRIPVGGVWKSDGD
ncbi:heparinase II/III family protein [Phycisphaerales bacterium AB-hyl4]|uniref:Heparinase II/III family protein n=1 Tax=Natronomicrosphaera hydrolytica TaxID=3242702 RepID=A0ABV4U7D0_9BACT